MPIEIEQFEQIEAYLLEEMTPEARQSFEAQMARNEDLREAVEDYRVIYEGFRKKKSNTYLGEVKRFEAQLQEVEKQPTAEARVIPMKPKNRLGRLVLPLSIAASVLSLIFVGLHWYSGVHFRELALETYEQDKILPFIALGGNKEDDIATLFNNGNYQAVISQLSTISADKPAFLRAQYVLAQAYFKTEEYKKSAIAYDYVINNYIIEGIQVLPEVDPQKLQWDRVLAYAASGQLDDTFYLELDAIIKDTSHSYREKAIALKQQTQGFWSWWR